MRNISFALTTEQVRSRRKTVTRRMGWTFLKPGTLLQPIVKGQGIPKGGHVEKIGGPIRVLNVRRERLSWVGTRYELDVVAEGFPLMTVDEFIAFFCRTHGCTPETEVTRIQFEFVEERGNGD